jgi:hypothetical protein
MKKLFVVLGIILMTTILFSFTDKEKKVNQPETRKWQTVLSEINIAIGYNGMVKLTPKLESLFNELYQLRPDLIDGESGPNVENNSLSFCWRCDCSRCGHMHWCGCRFYHNCPRCCDACGCNGMDCPCWSGVWVGQCGECFGH